MFFNHFFDFDSMHDDFMRGDGNRMASPVNNQRLYSVLGVSSSADASEIKKAYRKLAMQCHPDKGGDGKEFQEVSTAYDILSNKEKRAIYDQYGEEALISGAENEASQTDNNDYKRQTEDVKKSIVCSLEDLYMGKTVKMKITHMVVCKGCCGKGGSEGYMRTCGRCQGQGSILIEMNDFVFHHRAEVKCPACGGQGAFINKQYQCQQCQGQRVLQESKQTSFYIEKGMTTGSVIRLHGAADEAPGLDAGDCLLVINERPHAIFRRSGPDLRMSITLSLGEALCGFTRSFQHLDGREVFMRCNPGEITQSGDVKVLVGEGMPIENNISKCGSLFVEFRVEYPTALSADQITALRSIFQVPSPIIPDGSAISDLQPSYGIEYGHSIPDYVSPKRQAYEEDDDERKRYRQGNSDCPVQ